MINDLRMLIASCKKQDAIFYCAAIYFIFEFLRPHTIFPWLGFLPWTRLSLIFGLLFLLKEKKLQFQWTHVLLLMFVIVVLLSSVNSSYPEISFAYIDVPISWLIVVLVVSNAIRTLEQFKLILILFFLIIFKMSLYGAKTWAMRGFSFTSWGIAGPHGWFENSGELALIMVIFTIFSFGFLVALEVKKKIYYLAPITGAMTVIAASSRGSQLALAVVLIIAALTIWKVSFKNIVMIIFVSWLGYALLPAEQKERFETMGTDKTSESRLVYWEKGMEMLDSHKALGVGYNVFAQYFADYYASSVAATSEEFKNRKREVAHNTFVQAGSEMGYLGLIVYVLMIWHVYSLSRQIRKRAAMLPELKWVVIYSRYIDLALIGYLIGSFFMSVLLYPYIYLFLSLSQGLANTLPDKNKMLPQA